MPRGVFLVFTNCTDPAREEEFNRWYSHTHLPDLSAAKGFVSARRYVNLDPDGSPAKYVAAYEFESDNLSESVQDLVRVAMKALADGRHIECIEGGQSFLLQEIDPASLEPLEHLDYPREIPESIREGVQQVLGGE